MFYLIRWLFCWIFLGRPPCKHTWSPWTCTQAVITSQSRDHTTRYGCSVTFTRRCLKCQRPQEISDAVDTQYGGGYNSQPDAEIGMQRLKQALKVQLGVSSPTEHSGHAE